MKKSTVASLGMIVLLLAASCGGGGGGGGGSSSVSQNSTAGHTPFVISIPECRTGSMPGAYGSCGVHFSYTNTSSKTVSRIKISCMVYADEQGTNPFMGTNHILADFPESGVTDDIASGDSRNFILNLDPYIYCAPSSPYLIDYFFVKKITFTDGSTWEDKLGTYSVRSW